MMFPSDGRCMSEPLSAILRGLVERMVVAVESWCLGLPNALR